jgi:DNA invertase Pin-like site-specific DNA recombinase
MKQDKRYTKFTQEEIQDIISNYQLNHSLKKIADIYKCGQQTIKRILTENNIPTYSYTDYYKTFGLNLESKKEQIIDLYTTQNKSITEIGNIFKVGKGCISSFLRKNKIKTHICNNQPILLLNKEKVIEIYNKTGTIKATAKHFNCDGMSIAKFFDDEKIPYKQYSGHNTTPFTEQDKTIINDLINKDNKLMNEIGKLYNCSGPRIASFCNRNNIKRPTRQDQAKINGLKSIDSYYRRSPYTLPSSTIVHLQGYEPKFLDHVFKNNLLKEDDIVYKVSKIRYYDNTKPRWYFPDFYIPKLNLIIEIKSGWVLQKQTAYNAILKEQATHKAGFNYLLILDNNFEEFNKLIQPTINTSIKET